MLNALIKRVEKNLKEAKKQKVDFFKAGDLYAIQLDLTRVLELYREIWERETEEIIDRYDNGHIGFKTLMSAMRKPTDD